MQHPTIFIIAGKDFNIVVETLKAANVEYVVISETCKSKTKTKMIVQRYNLDYVEKVEHWITLAIIKKGLTLPFFNKEPVTLSWNVALPPDWCSNAWNINMDSEITAWYSDSKFSNKQKIKIANMINNLLAYDSAVLKIYEQALIPTFLHPGIQDLLSNCAYRKDAHIDMWRNVKRNFDIPDYTPKNNPTIAPSKILLDVIIVLVNVIAAEQIIKPSGSDFFKFLAAKGFISNLEKLVQRRDHESRQHGKLIKTLLKKIKKMYPSINECIEHIYNPIIQFAVNKNATIYE